MKQTIRIKVRGKWYEIETEEPQTYPIKLKVNGEMVEVEVDVGGRSTFEPKTASKKNERSAGSSLGLSGISQSDQKLIRSPMPGRIVSVSVNVWDEVEPGAELCILETMKMEQSVTLSHSGIIRAVFIEEGANVVVGDPLIQLD